MRIWSLVLRNKEFSNLQLYWIYVPCKYEICLILDDVQISSSPDSQGAVVKQVVRKRAPIFPFEPEDHYVPDNNSNNIISKMEIEPAPTAVERRQGYCLRPFKGKKHSNKEFIFYSYRKIQFHLTNRFFWKWYNTKPNQIAKCNRFGSRGSG